MASRIKLRKDTAAQWTAQNPVLADGEIGIELGNPPRAKLGNGVLTWNLLDYIEGPTGLTGLTGPTGDQGSTGAQGAAGLNGTPGTHGTNATFILTGDQPPTASVGKAGDFYVDRVSKVLWGPKTGGGWPASGKSIAPSTTPIGNANINTGTGAPLGADGSPWPSPWITTETSSSGIQDWNSGKLRLVSPSAAGQSSSAYANLTKSNIYIKYNISFPSISDVNAQFLFRASASLNVGFALNYNPVTGTIDLVQKSNAIETVLFTRAFNFVANQSITTDIYLIGNRMLVKVYPSDQVQPAVLNFDFDVSSAVYNDQTRIAFKVTGNAKTMYLSSFVSSEVPVGIEPTPTITLSQNFNSVTTAAAAGFVATVGSFAIASQGLRSNVASNSIAYYSYDLSSNNTFAQAKFIFGPSGTNVTAGLNGRVSSNKNSYYRFATSAGLGTVKLSYVSNGVVTDIDSYVANIQPNTTRVFRIECQNTSIRCYIDNQVVISYNEPTPGTTVNPFTGVTVNPGAFTSNVTIDDYLIGTLSDTVVEGNGTLFTQDFNAVLNPNPNPGTTPATSTGFFYTDADGFIVDPNGRFFIPTGGGTVSRPTGIDPNDSFWGWVSNNYSYANDNGFRAKADGWNVTELMVPIPGPAEPFTLQNTLEGLGQALDEWTALGIVCIVYPWWDQGYDPTSWATIPAEVKAIHDYVIDNYKNNQYVWLETMGEAWSYIGAEGGANWNNWSNVNTGCFNDAVARGWNNMQVFVIGGYGNGVGPMADSTLYDTWYAARASNKVVFGWHNFGSEPSVELMRSRAAAIKSRNLPLIITSFGQNWNDGASGFGQTNADEIYSIDFVRDYGAHPDYRTGGITWQATGPHTAVTRVAIPGGPWPGNVYSHRYCWNNGKFRPWYDEGEPLNEMGTLIDSRGALGYAVIGGGPIEANGGGQSGGNNTATGSLLDYGFSYLTTSTPTAFTVSNGTVKVTADTTTPSAEAYITKDMVSSDHWIEADVVVGSSTLNQFAGIIARVKTTSPYSYYKFEVANSSSQLKLSAYINGAEVKTWFAPYTLIPNTSVRLRMECVGTNTRCFANGTKVLDVVHEPDVVVPGSGGITSTANIATETFEGNSQSIADGTLITGNNSIARINAAVPVSGYFIWDAPDRYNSHPNNEVLPQFDTAQKKNGTYSGRFALERPPSFPTSWGGSYFHYAIPNPVPVLYFNFWWRMDSAMANAVTAGSEPNLFHIRTDYGGIQLTYLRMNTSRQLVWSRSGSGTRSTGGIQYQSDTWYKIETTLDSTTGTSRVIVKSESGIQLQDSTHQFDATSTIGFIEWGALWCDLGNFTTRGHVWFDDVELSSQPIGASTPSTPSTTVPGSIIANTTKVGINLGRSANAISTVSLDNVKAGNFIVSGGGGNPPPVPGVGEANSITQVFNTGATSSSVGFTNFRGDFVVSGGVVKAAAVNQDFDSYHNTTLTLSDHFVEADLIFGTADPSGSYFGVNARMSRTQQTWYGVEIEGNPGTLQLIKYINGVATLLGTWTTGWTANSTHKVRLECLGSSIRVYADSVSVISTTDTSITGNVNVGIHGYAGSNVDSVTIDNFYAQIITGGSNPGSSVTISEAFNSDPIPFTTRLSAGGFERGAGGVLSVTAATATDHEAYHNTDLGSSDHWVEVDVVRGTTTTTVPGGGTGASQATTARFFYGGTGIYNTPIADWDVQVHPRSAAIVQTLANGTNDRGLTTEAFGTSIVDYDPNGETYQLIIMNDNIYGGAYGGSGQWGFNNATYLYPTVKLQPGFQWPSGTDGAFVIRDWANDRCINLWIPSYDAANKRILAHWGGVFPANSDGNSMYPNYSQGPYQQTQQVNRATGAGAVYGHTAIGTSAMQGMLLFDDLIRGTINHALNFATRMIAGPPQSPGTAFFYPATTNDGFEYGPDRVEAGARFQLTASDATINAISHAGQRMIARCLKDYGAFVSDFAGAMMTYGSQRPKVGSASEAALYTNYGWSLAGDGWNPMNEIPWSQARIVIPGPNSPVMTQGSASVFIPAPTTVTTDVTDPLGSIFGVHARMSTSTKTSYSAVSANGSAVILYKYVNGTQTQLGSWTTGWGVGGSHKIRLQCVGTAIKVFADGVEVISVNDSSITTGTRVGVRGAAGSVKGAILLDNFAAQSLGSPTTTTPAPSGAGGGAAPPTGSTLSDTFDSLLNFTIIDGAAQLVSGRLGVTSLNTDTIAQHKTDMGVVNHYVEADCIIGSADAGTYWAVLARMSTTGRSFYAAETVGDRQRVAIVKVINGVKSTLGEYITGWPLNSTRKIGLQVNGSTLTLYTEGAARLTVTDNALTAETLVGVRIISSTSTSSMLFDNFRATTLASTPSTGGNTSGGGGTTTPPPSGGGGTTTPPPSGGGGTTTPPPSGGGGTTTPPPSGGGTNVAQGSFSTSFNADGGAAANGMADTPPNGLHGYNIPLAVSGGVAYPSFYNGLGYGDCVAFPAQNDINANQYAKALIHIDWSGKGPAYTGVMVRINPTSGSGWSNTDYSWYKFELTPSGIRAVRVMNFSAVDIWNGNWTLNPNTTYEFYLEIRGNTLKGRIDGVDVFTVTDFNITTGKPGITLYNEDNLQRTTIEYFEAGSL